MDVDFMPLHGDHGSISEPSVTAESGLGNWSRRWDGVWTDERVEEGDREGQRAAERLELWAFSIIKAAGSCFPYQGKWQSLKPFNSHISTCDGSFDDLNLTKLVMHTGVIDFTCVWENISYICVWLERIAIHHLLFGHHEWPKKWCMYSGDVWVGNGKKIGFVNVSQGFLIFNNNVASHFLAECVYICNPSSLTLTNPLWAGLKPALAFLLERLRMGRSQTRGVIHCLSTLTMLCYIYTVYLFCVCSHKNNYNNS